MTELAPAMLDNVLVFAAAFGIVLYPWQLEAFGAACRREGGRFVHRLAGISVPPGNGRSYAGAVVGLWRLLCGPPVQDIISAALDFDGAKGVLDHARSIVRSHAALAEAIEVQANGLLVPATGSRWTVTSRDHTASRGRHPTVVIYVMATMQTVEPGIFRRLDPRSGKVLPKLMAKPSLWCPYLFHGPRCAPGQSASNAYGCLGDFKKAWATACKPPASRSGNGLAASSSTTRGTPRRRTSAPVAWTRPTL